MYMPAGFSDHSDSDEEFFGESFHQTNGNRPINVDSLIKTESEIDDNNNHSVPERVYKKINNSQV